SQTTIKHFLKIVPVLEAINKKYGDKVKLKLIGDENFYNDILKLKGTKWSPEKEVEELAELNIGIMPLPDDEWANGKCGLKGLTYMALEIPTIMSPVGVNTEIIQDGVNGFLASTEEEWIEKISMLIENPDLRQQLGKAGRQTVVEKYSVEANKQKYLDVFNAVLG
ncbi:MAG: glycosyltransferase family 4 protein, partial [Bacteroidales bacterium]|nr:glycosyltransferase family 4 protein [Bacteroidales bacterium]